jgi:hypothetical protein
MKNIQQTKTKIGQRLQLTHNPITGTIYNIVDVIEESEEKIFNLIKPKTQMTTEEHKEYLKTIMEKFKKPIQ